MQFGIISSLGPRRRALTNLRSRARLALTRLHRRALALDPYQVTGLILLVVGIVVAILSRHAAGITLDEPSEIRYGRRIAAWFVSGFHDQRAVARMGPLAQYGGLFDCLTQLAVHFRPRDVVGTRHAASALCALAGVAATWKLAERVVDQRAGLVAAVLLASTPVWVGHGLFNPKDIPFGAAAAWGIWGMLRIATDRELPSYRLHIGCGAALGAALGVRPGGMFLLAYPVIAWLGRWWLLHRSHRLQDQPLWPRFNQGAARLVACWTAAWLCMLAAWPWAQLSPLRRPVEALSAAAHSPWLGTTLFEGSYVSAQHLPPSYLPVWFAITLPETYYVAGLCALVLTCSALLHKRGAVWDPKQRLMLACLSLAAFGPIAAQVATHSTIYDAQRHFLFILPPMAALAGAAIVRFLSEPGLTLTLRAAALGALLGAFGVLGCDMLRLHPYEYVYFNHLVGGLPGAAPRFETEYWGASYAEGMRWLADQLDPNDLTPVRVATCNHDDSVRLFLQEHPELAQRVKLERKAAYADILLATTRYNCHKSQGEVLHIVERMGVPFLYVLQRRALVSNGHRPASENGGG